MSIVYAISKGVAKIVNIFCFSLKVYGKENRDNTGRCMIVSNHVTWFDPVILGGVFKRQIHFMAKEEIFKSKFGNWFFKQMGAFPVARGKNDFGALKKSITLLKSDKCLGIFPEGTRIEGGMGTFQKGAAAIALKTNATIIPVCFQNPYRMFKKRCHLIIGQPFCLNDRVDAKTKDAAEQGTEALKEELSLLAKELESKVQ